MLRIIGVMLGLYFGGLLGAIAGYFIAGWLKSSLGDDVKGRYQLHAQGSDLFFEVTMSLLGHMAKADGRVSEEEIAHAEALMAKMGVADRRRQRAIELFKQGTLADFDLSADLRQFSAAARFRPDLKRNLLLFLVEMAMADGDLHAKEETILRRVAEQINIDKQSFEKMLEMLKAQHRFSHSGRSGTAASTQADLSAAYQALGVAANSTDKQVKTAYRKLMSQYHPDKMIAKGVPEDMLSVATEKTQEIQAAYDLIERSRRNS